mmetsp:Transcript_36512/g.146009  ORF Transcript_36512/g.146009 Transcript_36512/m.146009 type:complete len:675 (+) Transcript_36512:760-2784(+)
MHKDVELQLASSEVVYSVQKMAELLKDGTDTERTFVLEEIQQLFGHCMDDILRTLLPIICTRIHLWKMDVQLTAAATLALLVLFQIPLDSARGIARASMTVIKTSGKNLDLEELAFFYQAWASILVEVIPRLVNYHNDAAHFIKLVDDHIGSRDTESRKFAARILGALGGVSRELAEGEILPRMMRLSEDEDVTVRGTTAEAMKSVGGSMSEEVLQETIWVRLVEYLDEDDVRIQATSLRTIAQIVEKQRGLENSERKLFKESLPPILMRQIRFANASSEKDQRLVKDEEYTLLDVCSDVFGELLYSVALFYQKGFRKEALKAYVGMATCNGPIIRRNTAFNLPGVCLALGDKFGGELSAVAEYLSKDKDAEVRWIVSSGVHETVKALARTGKIEKLGKAVATLLYDKNPAVSMNAFENLGAVVLSFLDHGHTETVRQLGGLLKTIYPHVEGSWRMQKLVSDQIAKCVQAFPPALIFEVIEPALFKILENGMPVVQNACMDAIVRSFAFFDNEIERDAALREFWCSCAHSEHPYRIRIAMIHGAEIALEVFSSVTFRAVFAHPVLGLRKDPISNVRLRLARTMLPLLAVCGELDEFHETLAVLASDEDVDVRDAVADFEQNVVDLRTPLWHERDNAKLSHERSLYSKAIKLPWHGPTTTPGRGHAMASKHQHPS